MLENPAALARAVAGGDVDAPTCTWSPHGGPSQWCQVFGGEKVAVCVNKWDVSPTRDAVHGIFQAVCGLLGLRAGDLDASPLK